jgi:hypothetical protein
VSVDLGLAVLLPRSLPPCFPKAGQYRFGDVPLIAKPDFDAISLPIKLEANLKPFEKL